MTRLHPDAARLVAALDLTPHPEGGHYRETHRATTETPVAWDARRRASSTAIYYLLPAGAFSSWHRVRADEVWHHYDGDPLELHTIAGGQHAIARLGRDVAAGERPQLVVPANAWQAAIPVGERYALCGCTVAPGFDFADFELADRASLIAELPSLRAVIERFTR